MKFVIDPASFWRWKLAIAAPNELYSRAMISSQSDDMIRKGLILGSVLMRRLRSELLHWMVTLAMPLLMLGCGGGNSSSSASATPAAIGHVFIIVLENEDASVTFSPTSPAQYLSQTLTAQGAFLPNYYGIGHNSLPNYVAMISGQSPNLVTQEDCGTFLDFNASGIVAENQQVVGQGCVYPGSVITLPDQLEAAGLGWKGYMEDMGNDPSRESPTCGHPQIGTKDDTQDAEIGDQYASRHDPFVYFHSIIDNTSRCNSHVVALPALTTDLATVAETANLTFITPNLCHDGHDSPCVDGETGGLTSADAFLRQWVPTIMSSPAYQQDGLLIIIFDESGNVGPQQSTACCNEVPGPNSPAPGILGPGGGATGAVLLSNFIKPGTLSTLAYNHFSMLLSIEKMFGLSPLGQAGAVPGPTAFGGDVYTAAIPANQ